MTEQERKEFLERVYAEVMTLCGNQRTMQSMRMYFAGVATGICCAYVGTKIQSLESNIKDALRFLRVSENVFRHQVDENYNIYLKQLRDTAEAKGDDMAICRDEWID